MYLKRFCDTFCEDITSSILHAYEKADLRSSEIFNEVREHYHFRKANQSVYVDVEDVSGKIREYVQENSGTFINAPLVVYGGVYYVLLVLVAL